MTMQSNANWWIRLVSPNRSITEPERRRQSQLLSILSVVIMPITVIAVVVNTASGLPITFTALTLVLIPLMTGVLFLNRRGYYRVAVYVLTGSASLTFMLIAFLSGRAQVEFQWITVLLLSTMLLPRRGSYALAATAVVQMIVMLVRYPEPQAISTVYPLQFFIIAGVVIAVYVQNRDALERDRQSELHATKENLQLALVAARMGTWEWNIPTGGLTWSEHMAQLFGLEEGTFVSTYEAYKNLIYADDRAPFQQTVSVILDGPADSYRLEHRIIWADGSLHWLEGKGRVYRDTDGKALRLTGTVADITERKLVDNRLLESEQRFRTLVEAFPDVILVTSYSGQVLYGNPALEKQFGLTVEAMRRIGNNGTLIHPDDRAMMMGEMMTLMHGDKQYTDTIENRTLLADQVLWRSGVICKIQYDGAPALLTVSRDITERKKAEEALASEHNLLRAVIDILPDNIFVKDTTGRFLLNNKVSMNILGAARQEDLLGKTDFEFLPPELAEHSRSQEVKILESGQPIFDQEEFQPWMTDEWRWLVFSTIPFHDDKGNVIGLVGKTSDITRRKRAEAKRLEAQQMYETIFRLSPQLIAVTTEAEGRYIAVNDAHEQLSGYRPDEIVGHLVDDFEPWASPLERQKVRQLLREQNQVRNLEVTFVRRSGERFAALLSMGSLEVDGQPCRVSIVNDISELKKAEDALRQYAARLNTLYQINRAIQAAVSLEAIAQAALSQVRRLIPCQAAVIYLNNVQSVEAPLLVVEPGDATAQFTELLFTVNNRWIEPLYHGQPFISADLSTLTDLPTAFKNVMANGLRGLASLPLLVHGDLIGALTLLAQQPETFTDEFIQIGREVADQLAIAVENVQLYAQVKRHAAELENRVAQRTAELTQVNLQLHGEIVQREKVEQVLRKNESQLRSILDSSPISMLVVKPNGDVIYANPVSALLLGLHTQTPSKYNVAEFYAHPTDRAEIRKLLENQGFVKDREILVRSLNRTIWQGLLSVRPFEYADQAAFLVAMVDVTDLRQTQESEEKHRTLTEALLDSAIALTSSLELDAVVKHIMRSVYMVAPHDVANLMILEGDEAQVISSRGYVGGTLDYTLVINRFNHREDYVMSELARTHQPMIIADITKESRFKRISTGPVLRGYMGIPIVVGQELIGVISLGSQTAEYFTETQAKYLKIFAVQAGIAIQNARLFEQAKTIAALEERQRLARDLHDSVTQTLFSANMLAEALPMVMEQNLQKSLQYVHDLHQLTRGAMAEMRTLLVELRPEAIARTELGVLLTQICDVFTGKTQIEVSRTYNKPIILPVELQLAFYRVAQEALSNIAKHARASHVQLELASTEKVLELRIRDDGQGFDLENVAANHFGLTIMRERAANIQAEFRVSSRPGDGTEVHLKRVLSG